VITRLDIFDFDGTLFQSPQPPEWWKKGSWFRDATSLDPPCVPKRPGSEWWNKSVVGKAKKSRSNSKTFSVLLTGRWAKVFEPRVRELLKQQGLSFDHLQLPSSPGAIAFKSAVIAKLLDRLPDVKEIEVYDDHAPHAQIFKKVGAKRGIDVRINNVAYRPHEPECPSPLEHLIREARITLW